MLGRDDLVLCSGSLLLVGLVDMIEAASASGFPAITVWPNDYRGALAEGHTPADLCQRLADHGIVVADLDPLLTWLPPEVGGGVDPGPYADAVEADFYEMAEALGARSLNLAQGFGDTIDLDGAAEAFAGVCDRAREHGLNVTIEFLPWSGIPDVATALELVERAGRANGQILVDAWHWFRGPSDLAQLRAVPGDKIGSVQISDAPNAAPPDLITETMQARRLPGDGDIPLVEFVRALDATGANAPIGVEVFSAELQKLSPEEAARRCATAGRSVLSAARQA
ncbi:MAG: sugar phosphate isomerase/epimerase [Deltaproteobacteria bacterium]|nr:sugar phosphate isomerase/epimerase [Deltaproteobacteria bacterium]MBW2392943.1 sugar phosphate isomerase/epimerase [Deltaproteobacteria bacterium]